ncbi:MAG: hypothetical protein WA230_21390, partial [Xanthobacteraceae bacterium]
SGRSGTGRYVLEVARANAGAPGVDGRTFEHIEASGLEEWLAGLGEDLVASRYSRAFSEGS